MTEHFPPIVMELSRRVGLTPAKWREENNKIVIHFTTGQKIVFEREPEPTPAKEPKTPAIKTKSHAGSRSIPEAQRRGKKK